MARLEGLIEADISNNATLYCEFAGPNDGYSSGVKQYFYKNLIEISKVAGTSLVGLTCLDIGCGTGDMSAFLRRRGISSYVGVDIYGPSLRRAKMKYPDEVFLNMDILRDTPGSADLVFCGGALFTKMASCDNYDFLEAMVARMWQFSRVGVAFDFQTPSANCHLRDLIFKYDPQRVLEICRLVAPEAEINSVVVPNLPFVNVYMHRARKAQVDN